MAADATLRCIECGSEWIDPVELWRCYFDDDDELVAYCCECAQSEFGNDDD